MARYYGTTTQRGYGGQHQKLRAQWKPVVDAGQAYCHAIVCLKADRWIPPGTPWHLGHSPTGVPGPDPSTSSATSRMVPVAGIAAVHVQRYA